MYRKGKFIGKRGNLKGLVFGRNDIGTFMYIMQYF